MEMAGVASPRFLFGVRQPSVSACHAGEGVVPVTARWTEVQRKRPDRARQGQTGPAGGSGPPVFVLHGTLVGKILYTSEGCNEYNS
jgi:hypothetical protein